ncbi:XamI family restriction endonuclease [Janibacter melonis]|uniref:XamI family restriction endonuclease n=1 Tax=Janibacter melonis TaxID=262209 RepID=UPI002043D623|nr:XamI family restriction endonuclease [Janibacter melonis]MCM3555594.1 XamI family restriction endonuclease [Janibacter melonis]
MTQKPPAWSDDQLDADLTAAIEQFREVRMQEPLEEYLEQFDEFRDAVDTLIEGTIDLQELHAQAVELLTDPAQFTVIRYLASPAISEDDLKVLANATLSKKRIEAEPEMAKRIIDTALLGLDRNRFPWVGEDREPTEAERQVAVVSTAGLIAAQKVQTLRRNGAKDDQEDRVAAALDAGGFTEVPRRAISNTSHLPDPGEYCREALFGSRKADLIVRLWDGRSMPIECKVSNSSTNSVKRLNNDAAVKAKIWVQEFGTSNCVPAAVLSGVFKRHNLATAQNDGLSLFWAHNLDGLLEFIDKTRP